MFFRLFALAQVLSDLIAVKPRQSDIAEHHLGLETCRRSETLYPVMGDFDDMAKLGQQHLHAQGAGLVVLDN